MKFKHGILIGAISGFVFAIYGYAQKELAEEAEKKAKVRDEDLRLLDVGFKDGKDFAMRMHKANHPDCDRCPH